MRRSDLAQAAVVAAVDAWEPPAPSVTSRDGSIRSGRTGGPISSLPITSAHVSPGTAFIREVHPGVLAGRRPMNDADYAALHARGVRTIIDLEDYTSISRKPHQQTELAAKYNLDVVHGPMSPVFPMSREWISKVVSIVGDPERQPVYVHCRFGRERTNMVVALYRIHNLGWSADAAYKQMIKDGFRSPLVPVMHAQLKRWFAEHSAAFEAHAADVMARSSPFAGALRTAGQPLPTGPVAALARSSFDVAIVGVGTMRTAHDLATLQTAHGQPE